jgi:hypothetical protein
MLRDCSHLSFDSTLLFHDKGLSAIVLQAGEGRKVRETYQVAGICQYSRPIVVSHRVLRYVAGYGESSFACRDVVRACCAIVLIALLIDFTFSL